MPLRLKRDFISKRQQTATGFFFILRMQCFRLFLLFRTTNEADNNRNSLRKCILKIKQFEIELIKLYNR